MSLPRNGKKIKEKKTKDDKLRLFSPSLTRVMHHRAYDSRIYHKLVYGPILWCYHKVDRLRPIYVCTFFRVAILCLEFVGDQSMGLFFNNQLQSGCVGFKDFSLVIYMIFIQVEYCPMWLLQYCLLLNSFDMDCRQIRNHRPSQGMLSN